MAKSKTITPSEITSNYMSYILENGSKPVSVYAFAKENNFEESGYFGVTVPLISVKQCHFERYCNYIKN